MKKILLISALCSIFYFNASAQNDVDVNDVHGGNFNVGLGLGYYGPYSAPAVLVNYEFDLAHDFTLAPFVGVYSYSNTYYWGNNAYPYRYYTYRETIVPVGVKAAYYFDDILGAGPRWDFYLGASIGVQFHTISWENSYNGDRAALNQTSFFYGAAHIGSRYHINNRLGIYLDLSSGLSTVGVTF